VYENWGCCALLVSPRSDMKRRRETWRR
jgi:hypothetical protein